MFNNGKAFSGFSINDIQAAKEFYSDVLGLDVLENWMGLELKISSEQSIYLYEKPNHVPATFTVLNFPVDDIDAAINALTDEDIVMLRYDTLPAPQDEKGVLRGKASNMGPDIAWFNDPAGNILSVLSS